MFHSGARAGAHNNVMTHKTWDINGRKKGREKWAINSLFFKCRPTYRMYGSFSYLWAIKQLSVAGEKHVIYSNFSLIWEQLMKEKVSRSPFIVLHF